MPAPHDPKPKAEELKRLSFEFGMDAGANAGAAFAPSAGPGVASHRLDKPLAADQPQAA